MGVSIINIYMFRIFYSCPLNSSKNHRYCCKKKKEREKKKKPIFKEDLLDSWCSQLMTKHVHMIGDLCLHFLLKPGWRHVLLDKKNSLDLHRKNNIFKGT